MAQTASYHQAGQEARKADYEQQEYLKARIIRAGGVPEAADEQSGKKVVPKKSRTGNLAIDLQAAIDTGEYEEADMIYDFMKKLAGDEGGLSVGYAQLGESRRQFDTSMEARRSEEKQRIQEALANLQRLKAESRAGVAQGVQQERRLAAPSALPKGLNFVPGWEPGGLAEKLYSNLGVKGFQPKGREFTTEYDPEAAMQKYLDEIAAVQVQPPGG